VSDPRPPTPAQRRSADQTRSVWVTANAGTGKTRVLADRVLRLLLEDTDPEGILCITFTKAAAAEMTVRIEERLAAWATAREDSTLVTELEALTGRAPDRARIERARRLFARVLELPRGLAIMTIHALCGALLRRFPLEAGVAPHFETIDDRTSQELIAEARERVLRIARDRATPVGRALEVLAVTLADGTLADALAEALGRRVELTQCRAAFQGDTDALAAAIYRAMEVAPGLEPRDLERQACADGEFDALGLLAAATALGTGSTTDCQRGVSLATWLDSTPEDRLWLLAEYRRCFLRADGGELKSLATKKVAADPGVLRTLMNEQARLFRLENRLRGLLVARRSEALLRVAFAAIDAYEALKAHKAVLDYDDLIERTSELLHKPGKTEWVLYKLDARVDHVLIDEAQDTSPRQWAIVLKLTEEFFAGAGARDEARTLFVVGDEKQSIYSFQGADLANFRAVRERLVARAAAAGRPIHAELLDRSFRSVPAVLAVVDAMFALPEAQVGVVDPGRVLHHDTERANDPGLVELWPLARPAEPEPVGEPWPLPGAPRIGDEPERRVARAIARTIRDWLDRGEVLRSTGQPIRPGDVMILLGRRGILQERLVRALKQAGVPAAGADRLALRDHIAVQDLVALGRAVLLPEDDLNLACLLKSPLLGLDEDDLFELAWNRGEASIYERLRTAARTGPARFEAARCRLASWLERADFMPPFEFYAWVLGADDGRRRLLACLGPEAAEPIEAFLAQTLAYEQGHPATLEGFLHWLGLGSDELKRDPDQARDVVRVTTVHGAKGLEAPIVFLADAGPRGASRRGRIHWTDAGVGGPGIALPLWRAASAERDSMSEAIVQRDADRELEERRRLLYVALTRARDRLYVAGWQTRGAGDGQAEGTGEPSWHELVGRALQTLPGTQPFELAASRGLPGRGLRFVGGASTRIAPVDAVPVARTEPLPDWLSRTAPVEPEPRSALTPSRAEGGEAARSPAAGEAQLRFRRGLLVHRLLQHLPDVALADRRVAADRLLTALASDLLPELRAELAARVLALLDRPEFAAVFGPGSRAEQPICGTIGGRPLLGQIDRLVITPEDVLVVDLKSNRVPPVDITGAPAGYLAQLAAYRALLMTLYLGRKVRAGLLWTEVPRLDEVPNVLLDAHAPDAA
jgi:ATP-dependent helicase/nuclease subunit A